MPFVPPPILFLDIDGVLVAYPEDVPTAPQFTPRCFEALKSILLAVPRLEIVFSTTWRLPQHVNRLHAEWTAHGLPVGITRDGTPDTLEDPSVPMIHRRGIEITRWLESNPQIINWAVLDDDRWAIEPLIGCSRCVYTDPRVGLTEGGAEQVIGILTGRSAR
jgi:hypothetical protein